MPSKLCLLPNRFERQVFPNFAVCTKVTILNAENQVDVSLAVGKFNIAKIGTLMIVWSFGVLKLGTLASVQGGNPDLHSPTVTLPDFFSLTAATSFFLFFLEEQGLSRTFCRSPLFQRHCRPECYLL